MKYRRLLLFVILLIGLYRLYNVFSGTENRRFDAHLIEIDTASISSLVLNTKADNFKPVKLQKEKGAWLISKGNFTTKAEKSVVQNILRNLNHIKAKKIVAKSPNKWKKYELEDGKANRLQVFEKGELKEDFLLGKFNFNKESQTGTSYIRLNNENEIYAIDGLASINLVQKFDNFRNKQLVKVNKDDIKLIRFDALDTTFELSKLGSKWTMGLSPIDSTKASEYINTYESVLGNNFAQEFDELKANELTFRKITLTANNLREPIIINCYRDTSREKTFILHSSQNPDSYFTSDSSGIFARLFKNIGDFTE